MPRFEAECLDQIQQIWQPSQSQEEGEWHARSAAQLLDMIWGSVEAMLLAPTEIRLRQGIRLFQSMQVCVLLTLFPDQLKTHRSSRTLELLLATLMSIQGLLQLILHRDKQWANRIIHLMVGPLRQVVVIGATGRPAIQQCVDFLRTGIEGRGFEDEASVYCLFSSNTLYIGKALLNRAHGKLGIASRIMEHMTSILRKSSATSRTIRAILLRRCPLCTICFLPVKRGRHDWIKASETVAIRTLRPQGNIGQCKGKRPSRSRKGRRRPPPRFRQPSSQGLWSSHECLRQICIEARKNKDYRQPLWTIQTFKQAYREKQQSIFAKTGKFGCLPVYAARNGGLLALWACQSGSQLNFRQFLRGVPPERAVVRLARLVQMVQGYVKQTRGFRHVDKLLHRFRMPSRSLYWFKSSSPSLLSKAKAAVRMAAKATARTRGSFMYSWIMERVKFAAGRTPRFSDRRNAVQAAKAIRISSLWQQGVLALDHWRRGVQVRRLPGNWDIIDRAQQAEEQQTLGQEVKQWMRDKFILKPVTKRAMKAYWDSRPPEQADPPAEEQAYVEALEAPLGNVLVQDDKDRMRTWSMPWDCLASILVALVLMDRTRWSVADISPQDLSKLIYGASLFAVPAFLRKGPLQRGSFAPYMYPFVKAKCYAQSGGHTCKKVGHSCFRKVVSFYKIPWRKAWRFASRALQILVISTGAGFSVWRLKDVIPQFKVGLARLRAADKPHQCIHCQGMKNHTTMLIADAAQMYEQVSPTRVIQAFDRKASILQEKYGASTITVKRQKTVVGWPGGSEHTRSGTYVVFTLIQLRRMLTTSCSLCFATLGDIVVQSHGLLIGGLLSMIAAVGMLSEEEEHFLQKKGPGASFIPEGWTATELVLGMRYVDDLLLISSALCHGCMSCLVSDIYSVNFEVSPPEVFQTWTDVVFQIDSASGSTSWKPKNPNRAWLAGTGEKTKERYPPFLGRLQCQFGLLRGSLLGRAARFRELQLSPKQQLHFMLEEFQELLMEGYPTSLLRALIHSFPMQNRVFLDLRRAVRDLEARAVRDLEASAAL